MKKRKPGDTPLPKSIQRALEPYVEEARLLAKEFVGLARERFEAEGLDYGVDSVRTLDRLWRFNRDAFDDGVVLRAGFYFGETLRAAYGGRYQWDARLNALALEIPPLRVFPIAKLSKLVAERGPGTLEEYVMILAKKIADTRGGARR